MASQRWAYDPKTKRYRDLDTGKYLSRSTVIKLRDEFVQRSREAIAGLAGKLADKSLTVQAWEKQMRAAVKDATAAQYMFGRGGQNAMAAADWGRVGRMTRDGYTYLRAFAQDIADGKLSEAQIAARAALYLSSTTNAYERGRAAAFAISLPVYPCDGGTQCKANCKCNWEITETETEYKAVWKLNSAAENCDGCKARAATYDPFVVKK